MDLFTICLSLLVPIALFYLLKPKSQIPSPPFWEYLPFGKVYPAIHDFRHFGTVLHSLASQYGPIFKVYLGVKPMLVTSNPEDIAQIITTTQHFPREQSLQKMFDTILPGGLFQMSEKVHSAARRTLRQNFNQTMLESFQPEMKLAIEELCDTLRSAAEQGGVVNVSEILYITTFRVITNVALGSGMDREQRLKFNALTNTFVDEMMKEFMYYPVRQMMTVFGVRRRFFDTLEEVRGMCREFITRRMQETEEERKSRNADALDTILEVSEGDVEGVSSLVIELGLAGAVTTAQQLVWCIYELCRNEEVQKRAEEQVDRVVQGRGLEKGIEYAEMREMKYIHKVWKECVRLYSVNVGFSRMAGRDVTLKGSGVEVKKGGYVYAFASRVHRDEEIWTDAKEFKPERWGDDGGDHVKEGRVPMGGYVPFSMGRKSCVGKFLADYEGPLIIAELVRRFRFELGCGAEEIVSCTCIVETAGRVTGDGEVDRGVPVRVTMRG